MLRQKLSINSEHIPGFTPGEIEGLIIREASYIIVMVQV